MSPNLSTIKKGMKLVAAIVVGLALQPVSASASEGGAVPSACSGQWNNCTNAFADDSNRATATVSTGSSKAGTWSNYGISIPSSSIINSVKVRVDFFASNVRGRLDVRVSGNGGATFGPSHIVGGNTTEQTFLVDVTNDIAWTPAKLNNSNLRVRATCFKQGSGGNPTCMLDFIPIVVSFTVADSQPVIPINGLIVYVKSVNNETQIFTSGSDGSNEKQLTNSPGGNSYPAWSRDGNKIAFGSGRTGVVQIWVMDADGSNQRQLTNFPSGGTAVPTWSPDGTRLAFASLYTGHHEIWVISTDGGNLTQLTTTSSSGGSNAPSWSPDGNKIAFASDPDGSTQVFTMDPDGTNVQQLTYSIPPDFPASNVPVWSPDSGKIAFWSGIEGNYGQIWVMNADGSNRQQLTEEAAPRNSDNPAWSPDGTLILFETNRNLVSVETWVMNADGSNERSMFPYAYGAGRLPWQSVPLAAPTSGIVPLTVNFTGKVNGGDAPLSFLWDFKDGTNSTDPNPQHTFAAPGTYDVSFTVTDVDGDAATRAVFIYVFPLP